MTGAPTRQMITERLIIKPTAISDAAFLLQLFNSPPWLEYIGDRNVHTVAEAETFIRERILSGKYSLPVCSYIVFTSANQEPIGTVGIYQREGLDAPDIGFAFMPEYLGKGYGFEAAYAVMQDALKNFGVSQLYAITVEANMASRNLLKKLGLHFLRHHTMAGDEEVLMLYAWQKTD